MKFIRHNFRCNYCTCQSQANFNVIIVITVFTARVEIPTTFSHNWTSWLCYVCECHAGSSFTDVSPFKFWQQKQDLSLW